MAMSSGLPGVEALAGESFPCGPSEFSRRFSASSKRFLRSAAFTAASDACACSGAGEYECFGYFEYSTPNWKPAEDKPVYRITMRNSLGETVSVELRDLNNPSDIWAGGGWKAKFGKSVDLSKIPMRNFFSQ